MTPYFIYSRNKKVNDKLLKLNLAILEKLFFKIVCILKILAVKYIFSYKRKLIFGASKWIKGNLQSQRSTNLHFITAYSYLLSMIHTQWRFKFQDYHKIFVVHFLVILQKYFKKNRNRNSHNEINLWRRNLQIFRTSLDNCSWIRSCSNFKISFFFMSKQYCC